MSKLYIYSASAGSGKTFNLTKQYLRLLFKNTANYRHILAVTFTNKAAAEMKHRILNELYKLAFNIPSPYFDEFVNEFNFTKEEIKNIAHDALFQILHHYSQLSVNTIDTFFQQVIRTFAKEIGLQAGFTIELDTEAVLQKVVDNVLLNIDTNETLLNWLTDFANEKISEGKSWNFKNDIIKLSSEIFKEIFKNNEKELLAVLQDKQNIIEYKKELNTIKTTFEDNLCIIGSEALKLIENYSLTIDDFSYKSTGVAGFFKKLKNRNFKEPSERILKANEDIEVWIPKDSKSESKIRACYEAGLKKLLNQAINYYQKGIIQYNTANKILSQLYVLGILGDISKKLLEYTDENNLFLISNSAFFLNEIIQRSDAPFVYEKTGAIYKHFMIDEFQDTSNMQYNSFKPLLNNSLSEDNTCLVVGDVKQSIYRWRNSDWRLLATKLENDFAAFGINKISLQQNFRSNKNIIDFNNACFAGAVKLLEQSFWGSDSNQYYQNISKIYSDVFQTPLSTANNEQGLVSVKFIETPNKDEFIDEVLKQLPILIDQLKASNYSLGDIAILVRNKEQGKQIANMLLSQTKLEETVETNKYSVISQEALIVSNSVAVKTIIAALKYCFEPNNSLNTTILLSLYNLYINSSKTSNYNDLFSTVRNNSEAINKYLPVDFIAQSSSIRSLSLYEAIEKIIEVFELHTLVAEKIYLQAFSDIVLDYINNYTSDIYSFFTWWKQEGYKKNITVSENQDAIRIMTIHKAKGLQFKAVIVPFCSWELDASQLHQPILWCKPNEAPFNKLPVVPVPYSKILNNTIFSADYQQEKILNYIDNLNLLYVAFTRAQNLLYIFCHKNPETSTNTKNSETSYKNVSDLLYATICNNILSDTKFIKLNKNWNINEKCFKLGELTKQEVTGTKSSITQIETQKIVTNFNYEKKLKLKNLNNNYPYQVNNDVIQTLNYGKMMHEVFSNINTINDIDKALFLVFNKGLIRNTDLEPLKKHIQQVFTDSVISSWFKPDLEIKNEACILLKNGKIKRPDRVVISNDEVTIIDYKFGEEKNYYITQVKEYIALLQEMNYTNVKGYIWYVDKNKYILV